MIDKQKRSNIGLDAFCRLFLAYTVIPKQSKTVEYCLIQINQNFEELRNNILGVAFPLMSSTLRYS